MMYIVGKIYSYNRTTDVFTDIEFPQDFQKHNNYGGRDYRIAKGGKGLILVQARGVIIKTWILSANCNWSLVASHDISKIFGLSQWNSMAYRSEWDYHIDDNELYSIKVEAVGEGGGFVCLCFGFSYKVFYIDLLKERAMQIANTLDYALLSRIIPITFSWPPKFPRITLS